MKKKWFCKCRKVMKISATQAFIAVLVSSFSVAAPNYAQLLERKISIDLSDVPLEAALHEISLQAQVKFVYSADQLRDLPHVTVKAKETPLKNILNEVLASRGIDFRVHERESIITLRRTRAAKSMDGLHAGEGFESTLQSITGTVTDAKTAQPMPGVNIVIKGTNTGTTTANDGTFRIAADPDDVLIFSFIGFRTAEIPAGNQTVISVAMEEDIQSLNEVEVNAGYYITTKATQTGNIGKITGNEIGNQPVSNPLAAMYGRVPGVEIVQSTGVPGGNFQVRIRGQNSIANGNDPLYIVDGVPFISTSLSFKETTGGIYSDGMGVSPLNSINPQDIESIEILKDADATAIYGSRGANGVILVTTKKGASGKTHVELTYREGTGKASAKMKVLQTPDYLTMRNEAYANDGLAPDAASAPDLLVWDQNRDVDWQKELIGGSALFRDVQLSLSGGEKSTQFAMGVGYHRETSVFPGDNNDRRISFHTSINNESKDGRLKLQGSVNYALNTTSLPKQDLTYTALILAPNAPPMLTPDGELNWGPDAWNGADLQANPLSYTLCEFDSRTGNLMLNAVGTIVIVPSLALKLNTGYTNMGMSAITTTPISALDPANAAFNINSSNFSSASFSNWIAEPQVTWTRDLGPGNLDALAGTTFLEQVHEGSSQHALGFSSEALMKNVNAADVIDGASSRYSKYRYHAIFARINYSIDGKYLVNLTARRDGSSRFGPGRQFANFGAAGAAWIFSNEPFAKSIPAMSFGKLRASYGITGNDQIGDYQYLDTYSPAGSGPYMGQTGLNPQRLYNADFGWESVNKLEAALELGFLEDRIMTTIAAYRNRSSNQLVGTPLPPTAGFTSVQSNFPAIVENKGLEIELTTVNVSKDNLRWMTGFNITVPRNTLVEFPGLETSQYATQYVVGEPLNISKLLHHTGVNAETGFYEFEDTSGDGAISSDDRETIRFKGRKFYGAISSTLQWKGIQLDFLIEYVKQTTPNYLLYFGQTPGRTFYNSPEWVMDRWQGPGQDTPTQKFSTSSEAQVAYFNLTRSDASISDGSFIRLKNASLSWNLPKSILENLKLEQLSVFFQGQNLLMRTNYKGLHPENTIAAMPPLRTFSAGLRVKF